MPGFPTISDSQIDVDSPLDEAVTGDLATRDAYINGLNASGNARVHLEKYTTGHAHTGGAEGPVLDDTAIDTGGIWKSAHIGAGAVGTAEIQSSAVGYTQLADGAVGDSQLSGDSTSGVGAGPFSGTVTVGTETHSVSHSLGKIPVVTNMRDNRAIVVSTSSSAVVVGRNIQFADLAVDWGYNFCLL